MEQGITLTAVQGTTLRVSLHAEICQSDRFSLEKSV